MKRARKGEPPEILYPGSLLTYEDNGRTWRFKDQKLAHQTQLSLPRGIRAAFRGKGDSRPVYAWDYADKQ